MVSIASDYQSEFAVSYEGSAIADNTMEVRDLAPSLLALGQAFDRANSLLNGDRASIALSIRATRPGSFEIALVLEQLLQGASDVLTGDLFTSAANLTEIVVGGPVVGLGLFSVLKRLRGKKPRITESSDQGILFEAENIRLQIPTEVARLYSDRPLRDQIEAVVRPLLKEGIDSIVFRRGQEELESVQSNEANSFRSGDEGAAVTEYLIPSQRLQIASLNFSKAGKWKLSDGANVHWYAMEDQDFTKAIQQGERFGKDDILVCQVLMVQSLGDDGKLKLDYIVQQVLQHILPGTQISFPRDDLPSS